MNIKEFADWLYSLDRNLILILPIALNPCWTSQSAECTGITSKEEAVWARLGNTSCYLTSDIKTSCALLNWERVALNSFHSVSTVALQGGGGEDQGMPKISLKVHTLSYEEFIL